MDVQCSEAAAQMQPCSGWRQPPASLILNRDEVHVWRMPLGLPQHLVANLTSLLSGEEEVRAARILSEEAGRRFVVSHGAMRMILSRYLDEGPDQIRFAADAHGKPYLLAHAGAPTICFSLSHSGELALCAVARGREVGVDVERIRPPSAWQQIAARYFSERENRALGALADDRAVEAFFWGWTRKEAYSKALGQGISQHWTQFAVSLEPAVTAELLSAPSGARLDGPFTLRPLEPGSGYVGAVAAQGVGWRLSCWQWSMTAFPPRG